MVEASCRNRVDSRCFGASKRHAARDILCSRLSKTRGQTTIEQRRDVHFPHPLKAIDHRQKRFAWNLSLIK